MTRLISILFLFYYINLTINGQDIYNETNAQKFAEYLFKTQQFDFALEEYERLVFMVPSNPEYKLLLLQSYRKANRYTEASNRYHQMFGFSTDTVGRKFGLEYLKIQLLNHNYSETFNFLNQSKTILPSDKYSFKCYGAVLQQNWIKADSILKIWPEHDTRLEGYTKQALNLKYKSPIAGATFSMIIPGAGKAYCGRWKDGFISLIFVGVNAWQTYRGFTKYGINKPHGWIFGSITAGFYLGNIYGSFKAVKKYNSLKREKIYHDAQNYIYSSF